MSPTASITRTACPTRRRMKANMAKLLERMLPHGPCVLVRRKAGRLAAPARAQGPALAGDARPIPHLALRGDAAADAGRGGDPLLQAFPRALSGHPGAGPRIGRGGARALERARLLRARAEFACRRQGDRAAGKV